MRIYENVAILRHVKSGVKQLRKLRLKKLLR